MAASASDKFVEVGQPGSATTLNSNYTIGDSTVTVTSTTNWPTATGVVFAIDVIGSDGLRVDGTYNVYQGTVATATSITNVSHIAGSGTDRNYTSGATTRVYIVVASEIQNRLVEGLTAEHNQDGTHDEALITSRTEDTDPDPDADFVLTYDTSATALKKAKLSNLSGAADGWVKNVLPAVSSVTANGNRSYTVAFDSTVASTLSEGMRLRTTRTSAATTNAFSLDGSNDYYVKTSPNKLSFTDDFVVSAWIYVTAYQNSGIAGRFNGTSGWLLSMDATGQIKLAGYNGGSGNYSFIQSYQSVPLNRWVHVAAQLDMSAFTNTTTTSYVMIDGVNVPALPSRAGTNPTSLLQAGNLEIGSYNGGLGPFPGYIDQVAIYSAKVTQATILASIDRPLTGSETSLASAYSNGSTSDLNTTTPNDLTATNGATTVASAPWGNRGASSTLDYALVMSVSGANATVQVPEGCTIPTTGGVSAVAYSTQANPYGFVSDKGRWLLASMIRTSLVTTSNATYGAFNSNGYALTVPIGSWTVGHRGGYLNNSTTTVYFNISKSALTGLSLSAGQDTSPFAIFTKASAAANTTFYANAEYPQQLATQSTYVMYTLGATTGGAVDGTGTLTQIYATPSGL